MKLGLGSYSYPWLCKTAENGRVSREEVVMEMLGRTAENEVHVFQFGDNFPLHMCSRETIEDIRIFGRKHAITYEMGTRGADLGSILPYIKLGEFLGAGMIRTLLPEGNLDQVLAELEKLILPLRSYGMRIAIENYEKYSLSEYERLFDCLPGDCFGLCLDTANSLANGESIWEYFEALGDRIISFHYKEVKAFRFEHKMGYRIEGVKAGGGMLEAGKVIKRLESFSPGIALILEQWSQPAKSEEETLKQEKRWVEEGLGYLRTYVAGEEKTVAII